MAAAMEMLQKLQTEITCGICRNYFTQPVTIQCGHSFCKACLSLCWRNAVSSCPECRQVTRVRELPAVNNLLAQLTNLSKKLLLRNEGLNLCASHNQVFKLFCKDDHTPLCVRCCQTTEHGVHMLSPVEEAAHNCREKFQHLQSRLEMHLEEIGALLCKEYKHYNESIYGIAPKYSRLHQFLMEEETQCIKSIREEQRARKNRLSQYMQTIEDFMLELQKADHQSNLDLLQNVKQLLRRRQSVLFHWDKVAIPDLGIYTIPGIIELFGQIKVDISLDPATASPYVIVSEDLKRVKTGDVWQVDTVHPEEFVFHSVLAEQTFSSGRQYWEVDVSQIPQWIVGIHNAYLRQKKPLHIGNWDSLFLLKCVKRQEDYCFQSHPGSLNHRVKGPVLRVGVYLDLITCTLAFYNVPQNSLIYRFCSIPFITPVTPIFSPGPSLPGTKAGTMILCPVDTHFYPCCCSFH